MNRVFSTIFKRGLVGPAGTEKPGPFVLGLKELDDSQLAAVGGKAANLAVLLQAGMPVPCGFCVTTFAFERFLGSCPDRTGLVELWARCAAGDMERIPKLSRDVQGLLAEASMPPAVREAVLAAWREMSEARKYAVRSSATVEDAPERSFAGQFESILNVCGAEALLDAVKSCWLSLFSARALAYLARLRVPVEKVKMAVLVQAMVAAECAGVVFTADPLTGAADRLVVECVSGLGEGLVQGTVQPERWVIEKASGRMLASSGAALSQPGADSQADAAVRAPLLSSATLARIRDLAGQTERLFWAPQDIEWAQQDGEVWLLQARPITTRRRPPGADRQVWSNLNTVENLPDVVTPLAWSLLDYSIQRFCRPILELAGADTAGERWLGLVAGRVYMNVGVFLELLHCFPGFRPDQLTWLFGGHQDALAGAADRLCRSGAGAPSLRGGCRAATRVARLTAACLRITRWRSGRQHVARITAFVDKLDELNCRQLSADALFDRLNTLEHDVRALIQLPVMIGAGIVIHGLFRRACRRWFDDAHGALANRLISRAGGMASAESALALWQLAASASQDISLQAAVQTAPSYAELAVAVAAIATGNEFLGQWNDFMRRHGHHAAGELDIATPRWSERPDDVLRLVQGYLDGAAQCNPMRNLEERSRERQRVLEECSVRLRNPLKRCWFKFMLRQTQEWVVFRENVKSEVIRGLAAVRRIYLELDDRMVRQGMLEQRGDILFLTVEEIESVYRGLARFDVREAVRTRREEFTRNQAATPPPVIVGTYDPARHTPPPADRTARELQGLAVSAGVVTGPARVILRVDAGVRVRPGEILVAPFTDPGWTPYFLSAAGLVTDIGGQLSHGSVVAREYGLPAVVNVPFATQIIRTGQVIRVDGDRGTISVVSD